MYVFAIRKEGEYVSVYMKLTAHKSFKISKLTESKDVDSVSSNFKRCGLAC